jgi:hypothetical protein
MVWHLVVDHFRRSLNLRAGLMMLGTACWYGVATTGGLGLALGLSLGGVLIAGPLSTLSLARREIRLRPLSRRQVWLAAWTSGTVAGTLCTTAAKVASVGVAALLGAHGRVPWSFVALSSVCDFVYAGSAFGLVALPILGTPRPKARLPRVAHYAATNAVVLLLVGGFFWGYVFRADLPTSWALSARQALALGAGAVLTLVGLRHSPKIVATIGRTDIRARRAARAARQAAVARATFADQLSGLPFFVYSEWRSTLRGLAVGAVLMTAYAVLFDRAESLPAFFNRFMLLPFQVPTPSFSSAEPLPWIFLGLLGMAETAAPRMLRHLRTLPLSTTRLATGLMALPALEWTAIWTALAVLHVLVLHRAPADLRPSLFIALFGAGALAQALTLCPFRWSSLRLAVMFGLGALALVAVEATSDTAVWLRHLLATAGGVSAAAIAWTIDYSVLRRAPTAYKPRTAATPARMRA